MSACERSRVKLDVHLPILGPSLEADIVVRHEYNKSGTNFSPSRSLGDFCFLNVPLRLAAVRASSCPVPAG